MESAAGVQVACNWSLIGGCELSQSVQTRITHEDIFIKPELEEIIGKQNAILLKKAANSDSCELHLRLPTSIYKIESVTTVCTAAKLELFLGPLKEYTETLYGEIADDDVNDEVCSYRYDIEVQKSGVTECSFKLLTSADEICIFGILLQLAPNPNGITTGTDINFHNVQRMLSNTGQKISPSAEKCMLAMQAVNQMRGLTEFGQSPLSFYKQMKQTLAGGMDTAVGKDDYSNKNTENTARESPLAELETALKTHIDNTFSELERKISAHLDLVLSQQNDKLDKIMRIVENRNVV